MGRKKKKMGIQDQRDLLSMLLIIAIVLFISGCLAIGTSMVRVEDQFRTSANEVQKQLIELHTVIIDFVDQIADEYKKLKGKVVKNYKNINYLIHKNRILEEKVAKLEAQINLLLCEEQK